MNKNGNQYNWKILEDIIDRVSKFGINNPKTKADYNKLIALAENEIIEWAKFKYDCIQRRNLIK